MKFIKPALTLTLLIFIVYWLNSGRNIGNVNLPALGPLLSPYHGYVQSAESPSDFKNKSFKLPELDGPVTVIYDQEFVPHIYAGSTMDAMFVQGYVQASQRLWQIDMTTRSAGGRLSEILGERLLERDQLQRRKGLVSGAIQNLAEIEKNPVSNEILEKFVAGVNYYISSLKPKDYPIEYKLMNFAPEPYSKLKIALYFKSMEQTLNSYESDLESTNTLSWLGQETYELLYPDHIPDESPVIPTSVKYDFEADVDTSLNILLGTLPHQTFEKPRKGIGSNNWAVHPDKTRNGHAIVCNDPHLSLTLPSIWFETHIHTPDFNVYGVALPGVPGVTIGFNEHVAWGMTNVGQDVADWFRVKWVDETKSQYYLDNKKVDTEYVIEEYKLKNGSIIYDTIKWTYWGPVVHENVAHPFLDLAYKWIPHNVPSSDQVQTFLNLAKAKNYQDYENALSYFGSPAQNVVFGSKEGDVALRVTGRFPIRNPDQGKYIMDGSSTNNDWQGIIPFEHGAKVINPPRGFVSSANQRSTGLDYPYPYHGRFSDYRGRNLNQLLEVGGDFTVEDMMAIQQSTYSLKAAESLPAMLSNLDRSNFPEESSILETLESWDYHFDQNSIAATYFEIWSRTFYRSVWDEQYVQSENMVLRFPEFWNTINLLNEHPDHEFFDIDSTKRKETAFDILNISFSQMLDQVKNIEDLKWSAFANLNINHLGSIAPFNASNIETGGHATALNATMGRSRHGPSWRMIVELSNQIKAYGIFPGGQSGNPSSRFYMNNIDRWAKGEYKALQYNQKDEWKTDQILFTQEFNSDEK